MKEDQPISRSILFNPRDGESVQDLIDRVLKQNPGYVLSDYPAIHALLKIQENAEIWKANFWIQKKPIRAADQNILRDEINTWRQKYYDLKNRMEKTIHKDDKR